MANLIDTTSDTAARETQDGEQHPVTPVFNKTATEKDSMAIETAPEPRTDAPPVLETSHIAVPGQNMSDEAFAAVKRGDALRLKSLLDSGLEADVRDEQGFTLLMRAATNGNVEVAKILLEETEDSEEDNDMSGANDVVAEKLALKHGNMSVYFAIQERKRRHEFNKAALDENKYHRGTIKPKKKEPVCEKHGEEHESLFSQILHYAEEKEHKLADTFRRSAQAVGHASAAVGNAILEGCHAAMEFCSSFFRHKAETATPLETAEMADAAKEVQKTVALIAKALPPPTNDPNKMV